MRQVEIVLTILVPRQVNDILDILRLYGINPEIADAIVPIFAIPSQRPALPRQAISYDWLSPVILLSVVLHSEPYPQSVKCEVFLGDFTVDFC